MKTDLNESKLLDNLSKLLNECVNETQIIEVRNTFTNQYIAPLYQELKTLPNEQKREFGNFINTFKGKVTQLVDQTLLIIKNNLENKQHVPTYNIALDSYNLSTGAKSLHTIVINDILTFFKKLNFQIFSGNEIVSPEYNFDRLNINKNHPARGEMDAFYINDTTMLRAHCTAVTAQILENNKSNDIRIVTFGNVYRNDEDDMTHSHQFSQIDIVWVKKDINLTNLKWLISSLLKHLFGEQVKTRFRLSHFPFTEPSFEVDMSCHWCGGKGCNICKKTGWIEVLGAGILHQNVLASANIVGLSGIAAGIGIERMIMLKYGINDIRHIYNNDFRLLNQFKKVL